jgi:hypothetical protein
VETQDWYALINLVYATYQPIQWSGRLSHWASELRVGMLCFLEGKSGDTQLIITSSATVNLNNYNAPPLAKTSYDWYTTLFNLQAQVRVTAITQTRLRVNLSVGQLSIPLHLRVVQTIRQPLRQAAMATSTNHRNQGSDPNIKQEEHWHADNRHVTAERQANREVIKKDMLWPLSEKVRLSWRWFNVLLSATEVAGRLAASGFITNSRRLRIQA